MPRKKVTVPMMFDTGSATATRRGKQRKLLTEYRQETGDPKLDGEIWMSRIALTRRARAERDNGEKQWRQYYKWYKGKQWDDRGDQGKTVSSDKPRDTATVNKTGSITNSIVPFLVNDEIKFMLKPQRPTDDVSSIIQQHLINYEWRTLKITPRAIKPCARDFVIIGHCVAKTGYTVEVDESRKPDDDGLINYADYIIQDSPYVERVNPLNFLFDLSAKDHTLHTARWCAEVFFVPFADVLSNNKYDRETLAMMRGGEWPVSTKTTWELMGVDPRSMKAMQVVTLPEDALVTLIEVWDWKYKNRIIYADGCPRPLLHEDWPFPHLKKFPYAMAGFIDVPNEPYPLGLPAWIEDQQVQLNRANTLEQDVMRKSRPRTAASEGTNPEEVDKYKNGDDVVIGDFKVLQAADLSQMFQIYKQNIERVIEEMTGADALLQGARLPSRTTAGEVGTRARLTGLKLDQHVEDFEEFVEDIAEQVLAHLKKFRTTDDVIEIIGAQGAYWQQYTNEDIQAGVDVEVNYFAAPKTDPALEIQQGKDLVQLAISAMPIMAEQGQMVFDLPQLFGWLFRKYGAQDVARFFRPALIPLQPLEEGEGGGAGAGLPPALAGTLAPAQTSPFPQVGAPEEGLSQPDLMMGVYGGIQ